MSSMCPIPSATAGLKDLKSALNSCKSANSYTRISDLREDCPYRINKFERTTTVYGETVVVTLEGQVGDDYFMRVYLPRRFNVTLTDKIIDQYNAGVGDRLHLIRRSPQTPNSNVHPLEFV